MAIKWTGIEQFQDALRDAAGEKGMKEVQQMLTVKGETIMTVAKRKTPVDFGTLRASGTVFPPGINSKPDDRGNPISNPFPTRATDTKVVLGFGGAASDYALVQHERTDYYHESGEAKFLERAFNSEGHFRDASDLDLFDI